MTQPLAGIKVVEAATWVMAPTASGVMAEWGADVIKIEHPELGDPSRKLRSRSLVSTPAPLNVNFFHANRNKRSLGLNIATPQGHELLLRLVETADVFLTNFLPPTRRKLRIDVDDLRAVNPRLIYARGSALGPKGEESERGGYDYATFWCRTGIADSLRPGPGVYPPVMPTGAMGDMTTGAFLAGAISAALLQRDRTGQPAVVDASLLATGTWMMAANVAAAAGDHQPYLMNRLDRMAPVNPVVNIFRTGDDRHIVLCLLQADWAWPEFCGLVDRPDLADRFIGLADLQAHSPEITAELDALFATRTLEQWRAALAPGRGVWEVVQDVAEVAGDPQVLANGYIRPLAGADPMVGAPSHLVAAPVQFDEQATDLVAAPELGQHTEDILLDLGYDWDQIGSLKDDKIII
ncbi:MAG TPA: CoA transferase [Acidimicrobiales bacterium]|nr:CoA transferase [Acidimicrobiales bacterium]